MLDFIVSPNMDDKLDTPCWLFGGELIGTVVRIWEFVVVVVVVDGFDEVVFSVWMIGEFGWLPLIVASALLMSSYETACVDRRKWRSNLAFCFRISSACSSFEANGAVEYRRLDGLVKSVEFSFVGEEIGDVCWLVPFVPRTMRLL